MKILIVDDDLINRLLLQHLLRSYGMPDVAVNGVEAVEAFSLALEAGDPYNLVCLDILMPKMDGHDALKQIRALEEAKGIWSTYGAKILMITALTDIKNVNTSFGGLCDGYLTKPIDRAILVDALRKLALIE